MTPHTHITNLHTYRIKTKLSNDPNLSKKALCVELTSIWAHRC